MEDMNNNSPVVEFYDNKVVFITGATGFMGKVDNQNKTLIISQLVLEPTSISSGN